MLCVDCFINGDETEEEAEFVYNGTSRCAVHVKMAVASWLILQEKLEKAREKLERITDG